MKKFKMLIATSVAAVTLAACGGGGADDGTVKLEFFQNKSEAVGTYDELIAKFTEEYPEIKIEQNHVPESETVLRSRLAQNDVPAIMGISGNATYGELAAAGVLHDFAGDEKISKVQPAYVDMLNALAGKDTPNGIPYAANANTVLYNKDTFEELGLDIPTTWDEFIAVAEEVEAAGKTPFYHTYGDAWTAMVPFNALAANLQGDDFLEKRNNNEITFQERYEDVAENMLTLLGFANNDIFGAGYDQGNAAFANGDVAMYIQGNWAVGSILDANPEANIGAFALPASNDVTMNRLVSGVDTVLTISENTKHKEEAQLFIDFLLRAENAQFYIDREKQFSAVEGVLQEDPTVVDLSRHFEEGSITSFPDHYYPTGMQVENLVQEFLIKKDVDAFLNTLDSEWDKVKDR
ncbi:ABC transporter substrate-binding protein [Alkalihalobacterium chitinilyticum]|uniref:Extracellular solute-binding protein n=1 Tax=Alkalihalobacterium chitinilyticum TaxID=2980103 RepID=A0ABT5VBB3_9BACI|nr:extracellular solute-binding protein [Alkalihalobacterium chitinilyticum]MDE5412733.1 extracellular solute-binding protein [Alkalihalobacterium chitinilyticum]